MKRILKVGKLICYCFSLAWISFCNKTKSYSNEGMSTINLIQPDNKNAISVLEALDKRRSTRSYIEKELSVELLSNLLWASSGISGIDKKHHTYPSAYGGNDIIIYVLLKSGVYIFDEEKFILKPVINEDIRKQTGEQSYLSVAPVELIIVSNQNVWEGIPQKQKDLYSAVSTGCVVQNIYLFCASFDIGTVARGSINRKKIQSIIKLPEGHKVMLVQTVGYSEEIPEMK